MGPLQVTPTSPKRVVRLEGEAQERTTQMIVKAVEVMETPEKEQEVQITVRLKPETRQSRAETRR